MLPDTNRYLHLIGATPLVPVRLGAGEPVVWCKLEYLNPSGSTKDRIAQYILEKAWRQRRIAPGSIVVEASSGSTSIAMALACAQYGLRFIAVMPEGVSSERTQMIRAYGGEVRLTPRESGLRGALEETERLARELGAFLPRQFQNPDNAEAHRTGTAREVLSQIPGGVVDVIVCGLGTGGTLVGLYQGLAEGGCEVKPVVARPIQLTRVLDAECCGFSSRVPGVVECMSRIFKPDEMPGLEIVDVHADEVFDATRALIRAGFPVGPSSGLNYAAAREMLRRLDDSDARVVTVFPDRMERYFSTELFTAAGE
jgi:cysteine synthase